MNQKTAEPTATVRHFSVQLSPTPRGARLARLLATEQLRSWGLPLDPARQVVAELAANAATHGRVPGRDFRLLLLVAADVLRVEVIDTCGDLPPRPGRPGRDAESGRGLLLVEALADRWGVVTGPAPRKTVWAELRLGAPEPGPSGSGVPDGLAREFREGNTAPNPPLPHVGPSRPAG
ncbi:ATP-binding protein [Streptomyces sp. SID8352]|uniref:ATP-binding protein n=1 Tax=Streptomyces sp. SID8352 TaxID=2690338 RepID=UPI001367CA5B|nr:ATP-binding protein [Streptomyces sp. SID8352]